MKIWGFSSAGRAPALQAGGQRFDPANLHHILKELTEASGNRNFIEFLWDSDCTLKTEHCYYECNYEKATVKDKFFRVKDTILAKETSLMRACMILNDEENQILDFS